MNKSLDYLFYFSFFAVFIAVRILLHPGLYYLQFIKFIDFYQVSNAEFSSQDCRELGFIKPHLMCSSCGKLETFGLSDMK